MTLRRDVRISATRWRRARQLHALARRCAQWQAQGVTVHLVVACEPAYEMVTLLYADAIAYVPPRTEDDDQVHEQQLFREVSSALAPFGVSWEWMGCRRREGLAQTAPTAP